ncbi:MAG: hypothetical protein WCD55_04205 [Bacteroidales bacterium]
MTFNKIFNLHFVAKRMEKRRKGEEEKRRNGEWETLEGEVMLLSVTG